MSTPNPAQPPPPPPPPPKKGAAWPWLVAAGVALVAAATVVVIVVTGGEDTADAQTVRFQEPVDVGPDPFIDQPADKPGRKKVKITPSSTTAPPPAGTFGGTGSDLVCDRDLLINSLKANPQALAAWAQVLGVEPTIKAVAEYISTLHPVTLTRDTRVTNHTFVNGRAVPFQSILAAGTAVLVDDYGNPVARCRCGNPLLKPIFIPEAVCIACPPAYTPPPACPYTQTTTIKRRYYPDRYYTNASYDEIFIQRFTSNCYAAYPEPPRVTIIDVYNPRLKPRRPVRTPVPTVPPPQQTATPPPTQQPSTNPTASWSPSSGPVCVSYTLSVSGFSPNHELDFTLTRPDGVAENYPLSTDSTGAGSYTFNPTAECANDVQGTYNASIVDGPSGLTASASLSVSGVAGDVNVPGGGGDELQCDPPRSQLEFEQCVEAGRG